MALNLLLYFSSSLIKMGALIPLPQYPLSFSCSFILSYFTSLQLHRLRWKRSTPRHHHLLRRLLISSSPRVMIPRRAQLPKKHNSPPQEWSHRGPKGYGSCALAGTATTFGGRRAPPAWSRGDHIIAFPILLPCSSAREKAFIIIVTKVVHSLFSSYTSLSELPCYVLILPWCFASNCFAELALLLGVLRCFPIRHRLSSLPRCFLLTRLCYAGHLRFWRCVTIVLVLVLVFSAEYIWLANRYRLDRARFLHARSCL